MTDLNEQTSTDSDDGRLRRTGTWLATSKTTGVLAWAFCAVLAVVVAAAVVIAVTRDNDSGKHSRPTNVGAFNDRSGTRSAGHAVGVPRRTSSAESSPTRQPSRRALPQAPADRSQFRQGDPVAAPDGMMWQQVGPFVLPFSTSAGPARIDGPIARGYTQTPQGAALAAWQASWRINIDPESLDAVFDNQIEPSTRGNKALGRQAMARLEPVPAAVPPRCLPGYRME
ncbi:hypothetical protein GS883_21695 [Rhodococcus hoagii]|nr:hypothetical protein [Prescottella equi]